MDNTLQIAEWRKEIARKEKAAQGLMLRIDLINKEIADLVHKIELIENGGVQDFRCRNRNHATGAGSHNQEPAE